MKPRVPPTCPSARLRARSRRSWIAAAAAATALPTAIYADGNSKLWIDASGDALLRRTDTGANGPVRPGATLPDVVEVMLSGWESPTPDTNPYAGSMPDPRQADYARLRITFAGLVNPPGPVDTTGFNHDPYRFGNSPVYGYVDLDVDDRKDTGGELGGSAALRYLANVARFGRVPYGSIGERAAREAGDIDYNFSTTPQYERTGADWALTLCGCSPLTVVSEDGNGNGLFDAGETWVVRGRLFERARGYQLASGAYGGSAPGLYDAPVNVRFSHSIMTDQTTLTLVFALNMRGAALLAGQSQQSVDLSAGNHTSIEEGLADIIARAGSAGGPTGTLVREWRGRDPEDYLDVTDWECTGLFGTAYEAPQDTLYAWTDTGYYETHGDTDSDGLASAADATRLRSFVYAQDGGPRDGDGTVNGIVRVIDPGPGFSLFDLDGNGLIEAEDLWAYGHRADLEPDGRLDVFDFLAFQNLWTERDILADFNLDRAYDIFDFIEFQNAYAR